NATVTDGKSPGATGVCRGSGTLTFALNFTLTVTSGTGTSADPFRGSVTGTGRETDHYPGNTGTCDASYGLSITGTVSGSDGKFQINGRISGGVDYVEWNFTASSATTTSITGTLTVDNIDKGSLSG